MRSLIPVLAILLFTLVFSGCRKDNDEQPPVITLTSPTENQGFDVFAEIGVRGSVYDDEHLEYVRIQLLDEEMMPVLPSVQLTPEGNTYTLNTAYVLEDVHMPSGKYYLQVQAHDGVHATNKYVALQITAAPRKLKYFVAVTRNANTLNVVKIDSTFQTSTLLTVTSDYLGSGVNSNHDLFYLGGSYTGDITAYDLSIWQPSWEVPVTVSPPFAWFTGMMVAGDYLYAGYQTGKYEKYDLYGNKKMSVSTHLGWAPRQFCIAGDKLITEEKSTTGPDLELNVRFEFSGAIDGTFPITENTVALLPVDATNICHITNTLAGQSHLYLFNTEYLIEDEPSSTLGTGRAYCAIPAGSGILIGHELGVYYFDPANLTTTLWLSGTGAQTLFLDDTHGWLLAGQGHQLNFFLDDFPAVTTVQTVTLADSIVAVHGVYNKD